MQHQNDILTMAWNSLFIGLFISGLLALATGGVATLNRNNGNTIYQNIQQSITVRTVDSTPNGFLDNLINGKENPLAFDIVLSLLNLGALLFTIVGFIVKSLVNYFTLGIWLAQAGVPGVITGLAVMSWQFWTLYHLARFVFKERLG